MHGLSRSEVAERIALGQVNTATTTTSRPFWLIIRDNVFTLFNAILTACFIAILVLGDLRDGLFFGIVVVNAGIGIVQELRAKVALDRLALLAAPVVAVRRDDETVLIAPGQVVLGDTVVLRAGDQLVADATVLDALDLSINESLLTGESEPVGKAAGDAVLSGALVATGSGHAVVTAVGDSSYASKLTAEIKRHSLAHSELRAATNRILVFISWVIGPIVILVIGSRILAHGFGMFTNGGWRGPLLDIVASIVGVIPEGLVLLISLAFGVAAIRLAQQRVLIQELAAVEVLARVDVLCLDKTGTLTSGDVGFVRAVPLGGGERDGMARSAAAALALFARVDGANLTAKALSETYPEAGAVVIAALPFASKRAFSALTVEFNGATTTWLLGAPERLFGGHPDAAVRAAEHAAQGFRTLALARAAASLPENSSEVDPAALELEPVAMLLFGETLRPDAATTLSYFAEEGVRCIIISGDNPTTVAALASGLGVGDTSVDARELTDDATIRGALATSSIFGRVTPDQKRAIVRILKEDGHTVAMTGDGVNDAMAIKDADLGIAMGAGTSASRAVARLVLLDNEFGHLPEVLAYGRRVIANVERVANLFLAKTTYGLIFAVLFALLLWQFPFLPRQLTLVSTLTIGIPSFILALAPNRRIYQPGILARVLKFAARAGVIVAIVAFGAHGILRQLVSFPEARSITTVTLWIVAFWILCVLTRPLEPWRVAMLGAMLALFAVAVTVPFVRDFFSMHLDVGAPLLVGIGAGMVGAIGIEALYRFARIRGWIFDRQ